jgi:DNA (cytosine-5)-methyltransferase 1
MRAPLVTGIDVFCGAGGLTYGLRKAGVDVVAGIDVDPACEFPFTANNDAEFRLGDIESCTGAELSKLYPKRSIRLLAGCAPCRPFSAFRRGEDTSGDQEWSLLQEFQRLVKELKPELVTMENVPDLASQPIFERFVRSLEVLDYEVDYGSVYCPPFGIPQRRRRLVLLASRIGPVKVPVGPLETDDFKTVRETIGNLKRLRAGETDVRDRLHKARAVTATNLERIKASRPGRTWKDWPKHLRAECHKKTTGATYQSVYARMSWDEPSPTITTQAYNFGTGRFGHPDQHRAITLREAAMLQTFPRKYKFVAPRKPVYLLTVGKLIGNAVPPRLAYFIGKELMRVAAAHRAGKK